jgi:hypothetical protein
MLVARPSINHSKEAGKHQTVSQAEGIYIHYLRKSLAFCRMALHRNTKITKNGFGVITYFMWHCFLLLPVALYIRVDSRIS